MILFSFSLTNIAYITIYFTDRPWPMAKPNTRYYLVPTEFPHKILEEFMFFIVSTTSTFWLSWKCPGHIPAMSSIQGHVLKSQGQNEMAGQFGAHFTQSFV